MSRLVVDRLQGNSATGNKITVPTGHSLIAPGHVLQVVQSIKTDTQTINSTSWTDVSGLSATITPRSTQSKILVMCNVALGALNEAGLRVVRNENIFLSSVEGTPAGNFSASTDDGLQYAAASAVSQLLDSPNTIAPIVYKVQCVTPYGTGRLAYINRYAAAWPTTYSTGMVSTITLMEIGG